jgi:hypothetical protein
LGFLASGIEKVGRLEELLATHANFLYHAVCCEEGVHSLVVDLQTFVASSFQIET